MREIVIHIATGFPILSMALVTEPLRVANREIGRQVFGWRLQSDTGGDVLSSSGLPVATAPIGERKPDALILLASYHPERIATPETLAWLRRMDLSGCLMGCVDTGALAFARAGLLGQRPAALHHEAIPGLARQFPRSLFIDRHVDFSPPRMSSAGGLATIDMTLALIAHLATPAIAARVGQVLLRDPGAAAPAGAMRDPALVHAVALMRGQLAPPLPIAEIARRAGLPRWRLTRLFRRHLHASPSGYYVGLRLERARDMLRNSALAVGEIASGCGYENIESFSRAYRRRFGKAPSRDRDLGAT